MADFARDLGYLDKFLASLLAHADSLTPTEGARLRALVDEEVRRWAEIRALLDAGVKGAGASTEARPAAAPTEPAEKKEVRPMVRASRAVALTVGSLVGKTFPWARGGDAG
jgi:hypothetical protein